VVAYAKIKLLKYVILYVIKDGIKMPPYDPIYPDIERFKTANEQLLIETLFWLHY
jgi:hypothetical protein